MALAPLVSTVTICANSVSRTAISRLMTGATANADLRPHQHQLEQARSRRRYLRLGPTIAPPGAECGVRRCRTVRAVGIEARNIAVRDILLAMRLNAASIDADLARRPAFAPTFRPTARHRSCRPVDRESGTISVARSAHACRDRARHFISTGIPSAAAFDPFQIKAGGNQPTMRATLAWRRNIARMLNVTRGDAVIDLLSAGAADEEGISLQPHGGAYGSIRYASA